MACFSSRICSALGRLGSITLEAPLNIEPPRLRKRCLGSTLSTALRATVGLSLNLATGQFLLVNHRRELLRHADLDDADRALLRVGEAVRHERIEPFPARVLFEHRFEHPAAARRHRERLYA